MQANLRNVVNTPPSTTQRNFPLFLRIALIVVLVALPLLGHALWSSWNEFQRSYQERVEVTRATSHLASKKVAHVIRQAQQMLAIFAVAARDKQSLRQICESLLPRMAKQTADYIQVAIADLNGNLICGTAPIPTGTSIIDREYFHRALQSREFVLSNVIFGRTTSKRTIAAAHYLSSSSGAPLGVIVAGMDFRIFEQEIIDLQSPNYLRTALVTGSGEILIRHPEKPQFLGQVIADADVFFPAVRSQLEGLYRTTGKSDGDRVVAFSRVHNDSEYPLYVRTSFTRESISTHYRESLIAEFSVIGIVLLLGIALALTTARKLVVKPIHALIDATQRMSLSDPGYRTGIANQRSEVGRLAAAFDNMAERLQRSVRALRALSAGNRTIIRPQSEQELLDAMCVVVVKEGGYTLAMVHYVMEDDQTTLTLRASAGDDRGHPFAEPLTLASNESGDSALSIAVRTENHVAIHDLNVDPRLAAWWDILQQKGFNSVISLPLVVYKRVIGAFTFVTTDKSTFDDDEVRLLDEMAADLAFGIQTIRTNAQRDAAQYEIERAAKYDSISGLPNRDSLLRRLSYIVRSNELNANTSTVMVVSIPRAKDLHDSLGHEATDKIFSVLATRLSAFREFGAFVGRLAFDEFGILLMMGSKDEAEAFVIQLQRLFHQPIEILGALIEVQAYIGIAITPEHGDNPELLVRRASIAARDALRKDLSHLIYSGSADRKSPQRLTMVSELRRAIEQHELTLYYQPKIDVKSGISYGVEALVRWVHPQKGMISPGEFIPLAEQTGLIKPLTFSILDLAARQQAAWLARGLQMPIAINLTARSLVDPKFAERFSQILGQFGVPAYLIDVEITESSLVEDPEGAKRMLLHLRELGCGIYIDDFGTGYSSLNYLVDLPLQFLKIDRSFIVRMPKNKECYLVVSAIISMGQGMGLKIIAEGVETQEEADLLRELGCDTYQGFLYGKPVPADQLEQLWASGKIQRAPPIAS